MGSKYIFLILALILVALPIVSAETSGGTLYGKKDATVLLPQECVTCTFFRLSSIKYPNTAINYVNTDMTQNGSSFYYSFSDTSQVGIYTYCGYGDPDGVNTTVCNDIEITHDGRKGAETGYTVMLIGLLLIGIIAIYHLSYKKNRFIGNILYMLLGLGIWTRIGESEYGWLGTVIFAAGFIGLVYETINVLGIMGKNRSVE